MPPSAILAMIPNQQSALDETENAFHQDLHKADSNHSDEDHIGAEKITGILDHEPKA